MKTNTAMKKARDTGIAYARALFKEFQGRVTQGEEDSYKWSRLPAMCHDIAKASVFTQYSDKEWFSFTYEGREGIEEAAGEAAEEEARRLMDETSKTFEGKR